MAWKRIAQVSATGIWITTGIIHGNQTRARHCNSKASTVRSMPAPIASPVPWSGRRRGRAQPINAPKITIKPASMRAGSRRSHSPRKRLARMVAWLGREPAQPLSAQEIGQDGRVDFRAAETRGVGGYPQRAEERVDP